MSEEEKISVIEENSEIESLAADDDENSAGYWRRLKEAKWYVIHTYSGYENKVKANLEKLVENRNMQDLVLEVVVPTETVVDRSGGKTREKKIFPGYVIVKMIVTNESWYLVRNTQGVTGFVGQGSEPIPLSDEEAHRLGIERIEMNVDFQVGDLVKIILGPFKGKDGVVEEVDVKKEVLKLRVDMFGRSTPVELEFNQVDKLN